MIAAKLKGHARSGEAITQEFIALMRSTFAYYGELNSLFQERLPHHLHQSELIKLLNGDIRSRLFNHAFCERIQESLRTLRRAIIRLEDLRGRERELPDYVNNLETLQGIAERVEALYQKHWEYYRYQNHLTEQALVEFLMEVDRIGYDWDVYLEGFTTARELVGAISGQPVPEGYVPVRIAYERDGAARFAVDSLKVLMDFLDVCYRFIGAVREVDPREQPLGVLQVEIAEPVEVRVAVPAGAEQAYRQFLQYLFLKDMLQREPLLRIVMEAVLKEFRSDYAGPPQGLNALQKELSAKVKALPSDGRFTISDRTFPDDSVQVMHDFFVSLERKDIAHDALLPGAEKGKRSGKVRRAPRSAPARKEPAPAPERAAEPPAAGESAPRPAGASVSREHIRILTDHETAGNPR